jgi:hypothetical protein
MSQLFRFKCKPCALEIHSTRVHDLHPGLFYSLLFQFLLYFFLVNFMGSDILFLRSIAPPWEIVHRNLLKSTKHSEEANDHTSLGDRLLPRHAPKGARAPQSTDEPSCMSMIKRTYVQSSALEKECHFSRFPPSLLQQWVHLIVSRLEDQLLFQDMCFWIQVWGYGIPSSAHLGTPIPLTLFFSFVHTLGTMHDSSLGV